MSLRKEKLSANAKILELINLYGITQSDIAKLWRVSPTYISDLARGRRGISVSVALRLEATFPTVSAEEWMKLQCQKDIEYMRVRMHQELLRIASIDD